jgi:peptidoglycan/LPS O-acetylase OafA/YrhL
VPVLVFVLRYLSGLRLALIVFVFLSLTALLSYASFNLIEDPLIRLGKRLTQTGQKTRKPDFTRTAELSFVRATATAEQGGAQLSRQPGEPTS